MKFKELRTALYRAFLSPTKAKTSYSQCGEDMVLNHLLINKKKQGIYVDVGCHHPKRGSNTYHFYQKGWRGILIDLDPEKIYACRMVRWRDKAIVAAISDKAETVTVYAPDHFSVLATINPDAASPGSKAIRTIVSKPLTTILDEEAIPKNFELLCIDAEGMDLAVLKGLDLAQYQPQFICIEILEAQKGLDSLIASATHQYLCAKQYTLVSWAGFSAIYKAG